MNAPATPLLPRLALTIALALALPLAAVAQPRPSGAATLLLRTPSASQPLELPFVDQDVTLRVSGIVARAVVQQVFTNPTSEWAEGVYAFPLPENAAVDHLRMTIGDRVIEGEIRERDAARKEYEAAREAGSQAALLEQQRPNVFTASVANIGPGESLVVELEYQQVLRLDAGRMHLRFPMTITPRYESCSCPTPEQDRVVAPIAGGPVRDALAPTVSLTVELDAGVAIADVACPSHAVDIASSGPSRRTVRLGAGTLATRDFELTWTLEPQHAPATVLFTEPRGDRWYQLLMVVPPEPQHLVSKLPREIVFIIDTSGSMGGESIRQAQAAIALAIERLDAEVSFNVIEFNSVTRPLWQEPRPADGGARDEAARWVRSLVASGGTEMFPALALALDGEHDPTRLRQVVFATDGAVGNEDALFKLIADARGDSRLFTIGIGSAPNAWFMTKAAEMGLGTFTFIGGASEVEARMGELFTKLESPVLTDIVVEWPEGADAETYPDRLPDLYAGQPLVVSAALTTSKGWARITGRVGDAAWSEQVDLGEAHEGTGIATLWAREAIDSLTSLLHDDVPESEIRPAIVELALEHHLMSKYTSLVAVDRTPVRPEAAPLVARAVPLGAPDGSAQFGGYLPQGGTSARRELLAGAALLACAALLLRRALAA